MFNKSYNVAAAERANKELANSVVKYTVKMIDDSVETFYLSTETRGMNLLDSVCDCLELLERDYFGLQYKIDDPHGNQHIWKWVKMDKLMKKQIKDDLMSKTFYLRVRFVPNDVNQMQETYTRYQLFLQIKQDISSNRINCPKEIAVQLAGCALQSELNDYNTTIRSGYVGEFRFIQDQTLVFEQEVANFHKTLKGLRAEEAELKFLTISKQLLQYGCDLYNCELMGKALQFGFHALGISMFPSDKAILPFLIPWSALDKILNKNKAFLITVLMSQPIVTLVEGGAGNSLQAGNRANLTQLRDKPSSGFKLIFPSTDAAKEAWKSCIECHSFFRVRDPKQIQGSSSVKRSHSFFRLTSMPTLFSGRRTLPELLDIRKRSRTLERSFIRTPSKRYTKKNTAQFEKQSILSGDSSRPPGSVPGKNKKPSISSLNSNNKEKTKVDMRREIEPLESENSDVSEDEFPHPDTGQLRPTSLMTQSVRHEKSRPTKEFTKQSVTHSSMPRRPPYLPPKQSSLESDAKDPNDAILKTTSQIIPKSQKAALSMAEVKAQGLPKSQVQSKGKLSGSMTSLKNPLSNSTIAMSQSTDKLVDLDSCVEISMKAQDSRYGFTIKGGANTGSPVIVTKVSAGSAADVCEPSLSEGDQIIKINNKFADDLTNDEIKEIIRSTGHKKDNLLVLTVKCRLYIGDDTATNEDAGTDEDVSPLSLKETANDLRTEMKLLEESLKNGSAIASFEKLYKQKQGLSMTEARKSENVTKNRYKDILPYDQTRISFRGNEYINANTIKFDVPKSSVSYKYIAAQGPLINTASDFLTMIWENKSQMVVMLTDLQEKGRSKCYKYWPSNGETTKLSHGLQITCETESVLSSIAIREMKLKKANEVWKFTHLQYLNWPDHDVPQKMDEFITFMSTMRKLRSQKSEHIVVHCSAGIGRTGVVITMDIAIGLLELKQPFTVISIVKEIRNQRAMLIQSQKQYDFVCRAIINYYSNQTK